MLRIISIAVLFLSTSIFAQKTFDAASVKPSEPGNGRELVQAAPGTVTMRNIRLSRCIVWAYHVSPYQVSGPGWLESDRFDITAKSDGPAPEAELRVMMQALLKERFKLEFHRQTKEMSAYVLTVAKGGLKIHESDSDGDTLMEPNQKKMQMVIRRAPASRLVEILEEVLASPVIDQTGLTGRYDVTIDVGKYIFEQPPSGGPPDILGLILNGLQREFGLNLDSKKIPLDLLIIDHAERVPVEN